MKRSWILVLAVAISCMLCVNTAYARSRHHSNTTVVEAQDNHNVLGVKIDAPNLVKINEEGTWTLGVEGGKDVMKDVFYSSDEYVEADKGYFAYVKVTFSGQVADMSKLFKKKEEAVE